MIELKFIGRGACLNENEKNNSAYLIRNKVYCMHIQNDEDLKAIKEQGFNIV